MEMDRNLALELVRVTEAAALACARWMGRGDAKGADQAAVDAMRRAFDGVHIRGTVVIGEGERDEARKSGARIRLITDGDVAAAIATCKEQTGIDILFGIGGAPEGVLAAAALRCVGGDMQGRLKYRNDDEMRRAEKMGVKDHDKVYRLEDLAQGEVMFSATGVTDGAFLRGVHFFGGGCTTQSVVMRS